jgi:hypothetical protein
MRRSLMAIVMSIIFSAAMLQAQRGGGGGHSGGAHGFSSPAGTRGVGSVGTFGGRNIGRRGNWNRNGYGYGWWPGYYGGYGLDWDLPYWDYVDFPPTDGAPPPDQEDSYAYSPAQRQVAASRERIPAAPVQSPKLIEIPLPNDTVVKPQPPALFVLTNGEKLESRRYVLSADSLQIDIGRKQRTIPISDLNVDATIAANQQRGLDVSIPQDRSSLFVGF